MSERHDYIEPVPEDEQDDPNGRIVARVHIGAGPTWGELWKKHVARNWARRFEDDDQQPTTRRNPLRRRGF